jgi:hypothetical protein
MSASIVARSGLTGAFGHEADAGHPCGRVGVRGALAAALGTVAV